MGKEEELKLGVLDIKFGPKRYICVMTDRRELMEKYSIDNLASEIANKPWISNLDTKINYDNKSAVEQYKDLRPFDEEELFYFKERLIIYRHERRRWDEEMEKKYGTPNFLLDKDNRKSWFNEKHPWIK